MEWGFLSAEELVAALRAGEVTSVELTDEAISRIERDDKAINAICVPDFDRARGDRRFRGTEVGRWRSPRVPEFSSKDGT
jgi:amidase